MAPAGQPLYELIYLALLELLEPSHVGEDALPDLSSLPYWTPSSDEHRMVKPSLPLDSGIQGEEVSKSGRKVLEEEELRDWRARAETIIPPVDGVPVLVLRSGETHEGSAEIIDFVQKAGRGERN